MNTLELRDMGVTPLSDTEQVEMNGGFVFLIPLAVALIVSFINDFGDIRKGFVDGYLGTPLFDEKNQAPCQ